MVRGISWKRKPCYFSCVLQYLLWLPFPFWAWYMHRLCLFPPFTTYPAKVCQFFSLTRQKMYLWLSIPKVTTPVKPLIVSFLWFPLASDLPHTDITHFPSTEDAGCNPFLSQVPSSSEVLCYITLLHSSMGFSGFPTVFSFLPYFSACTLSSAILSALHPGLDCNSSGLSFRCV